MYVSSFVLQIWNNVGSRVDMKSQETLKNFKTCIQEVCKNIGGSLQRYYSCNYNFCISQTFLCIALQWLKRTERKLDPERKWQGFVFFKYSSWYYKICYTVDILWYTSLPSFRSILAFKKTTVLFHEREAQISTMWW